MSDDEIAGGEVLIPGRRQREIAGHDDVTHIVPLSDSYEQFRADLAFVALREHMLYEIGELPIGQRSRRRGPNYGIVTHAERMLDETSHLHSLYRRYVARYGTGRDAAGLRRPVPVTVVLYRDDPPSGNPWILKIGTYEPSDWGEDVARVDEEEPERKEAIETVERHINSVFPGNPPGLFSSPSIFARDDWIEFINWAQGFRDTYYGLIRGRDDAWVERFVTWANTAIGDDIARPGMAEGIREAQRVWNGLPAEVRDMYVGDVSPPVRSIRLKGFLPTSMIIRPRRGPEPLVRQLTQIVDTNAIHITTTLLDLAYCQGSNNIMDRGTTFPFTTRHCSRLIYGRSPPSLFLSKELYSYSPPESLSGFPGPIGPEIHL